MIIHISKRFSINNNDVMKVEYYGINARSPIIETYCMTRQYNDDLQTFNLHMSDARPGMYTNGATLFLWCEINVCK